MCSWNGDHHKPESSYDTAQIAISQTSGFCSQHGREGLIFGNFTRLLSFLHFSGILAPSWSWLCVPYWPTIQRRLYNCLWNAPAFRLFFVDNFFSFHISTHFFRPRSGLQICWTWKSLTWNSALVQSMGCWALIPTMLSSAEVKLKLLASARITLFAQSTGPLFTSFKFEIILAPFYKPPI